MKGKWEKHNSQYAIDPLAAAVRDMRKKNSSVNVTFKDGRWSVQEKPVSLSEALRNSGFALGGTQ